MRSDQQEALVGNSTSLASVLRFAQNRFLEERRSYNNGWHLL